MASAIAGCAGDVRGTLVPIRTSPPGTSKITMLIATTRAADRDRGILFSGERGAPSFAEITVSMPPDTVRKVGEVQWPGRLPGNPETDFVALKVDRIDKAETLKRFLRMVLRTPKRRVLVFIHGFNNRFEDAVYRFAQIAHDSRANAVPVLFTWPSRGSVFAYGYDRESGNYSRSTLENLFQALARDSSVGNVSVLVHSMGNWVTLEALRQMAIRNSQIPAKIANVMLAAPDVDVDVFSSQIADMEGKRPRFTVFVSQDDKALAVSRRVWDSTARLGAIDPEAEPYRAQLAAANIAVLNLSKLRTGDKLNHGKFAESPEVVQLIGSRLIEGQPITDSHVGLGDRLIQVTAGTASAMGTATSLAVSAPLAIVDPHTRRNLADSTEELGRSLRDAGSAVTSE